MAVSKNNDVYEIDLLELFRLLWSNMLPILLGAAIICAATLGISVFLITPKYEAEASMYVNNSSFSFGQTSFSISSSELSASNSLAKTYIYILQTRETLEEVIKEAGLDYTYDDLMEKKMISTEEITGTAIFKVTVRTESPVEAERIANTIVKVLPTRIEEIVDGSAVRTVSFAIVPAHRSSPSYVKNAVIGFVLGAFLCCAWVVIRELVKKGSNVMIGSADDLRKRYPDITVLSLIPDMRLADKKGYYYSSYYGSEKKG